MNFVVQKSDLARELAVVANAAERKTTVPVLSMVRIDAADDAIALTATDLEVSVHLPCPAEVSEPGTILLPAKRLSDYVRLLPDAAITVKAGANYWTNISCARSKTRIAGMGLENWPELPSAGDDSFAMPVGALLSMVRRTQFAISAEESRFTLNGCLLERDDAGVKMVATDGHRLALVGFPRYGGDARRLLIPRKALVDIEKVASSAGSDAEVSISSDSNHIFFDLGGGRRVLCRKLTGNFPDYKRVLPSLFEGNVILDRSGFSGAVTRARRFADERSGAVKLKIGAESLVVMASTPESGETEETVPVTESNGEVEIALNADYILDFTRVCDFDKVQMRFISADKAVEFQPFGEFSDDVRCIVMPMRI